MEAGNAVKEGILAVDKAAKIAVYPFADGGEGTLEAFLSADNDSRKIKVNVSGPRGRMTDNCDKMEQGGSDYEEIMDKIYEIQPCDCSFGRHGIVVCMRY